MQQIAESLRALRNSLPSNFTSANVKKLQSRFLECQHLIASLPADNDHIKQSYKNNFSLLQLKIDSISYHNNSVKASRYYFKDAVSHLHTQIDNIIVSINNFNN